MKKAYIAVAAAILAAFTYGYGAGRANSLNPVEILTTWQARAFEKRLSRQIHGGKYSSALYPQDRSLPEWSEWDKQHDQIFGPQGLAETNHQEGMQAEEYQAALRRVYGETIDIHRWDICHRKGKQVLQRAIQLIPSSELEQAVVSEW